MGPAEVHDAVESGAAEAAGGAAAWAIRGGSWDGGEPRAAPARVRTQASKKGGGEEADLHSLAQHVYRQGFLSSRGGVPSSFTDGPLF